MDIWTPELIAAHQSAVPAGLPVHTELTADSVAGGVGAMADTIGGDIGLLPAGLAAYASYVDGFGGYNQLVSRFLPSGAMLLSISVNGNPARCGDFEPGALTIGQVPWFLDSLAPQVVAAGQLPVLYYSSGIANEVAAAAGNRPHLKWSAHYAGFPHICGPGTCGYPQADATQWTDTGPGGENYDRSLCFPNFLASASQPHPIPSPPEGATMLQVVSNHDGRLEAFSKKDSGEVVHSYQKTAGGDWERDSNGDVVWHSLGNPGK